MMPVKLFFFAIAFAAAAWFDAALAQVVENQPSISGEGHVGSSRREISDLTYSPSYGTVWIERTDISKGSSSPPDYCCRDRFWRPATSDRPVDVAPRETRAPDLLAIAPSFAFVRERSKTVAIPVQLSSLRCFGDNVSHHLSYACYDVSNRYLVALVGGRTIQFCDVPQGTADEFQASASKSEFLDSKMQASAYGERFDCRTRPTRAALSGQP